MDLYLTIFALGAIGLVVMALSGIGHHAGHAHAGHHAGHAGHAGHARHAHTTANASQAQGFGREMASFAAAALSPRLLFSIALGFGAAGLLLRTVGPFGPWAVLVGAIVGAAIFEAALMRPLWNAMLRFASNPAMTLETAVGDEVTAVSAFGASGDGMVRLTLDGRVVDLLATLDPSARGHHVARGDVLRITDVDARRNRCTVAPA